ncbi:DUF4294 domain-containing protein [Flavivirga rizhaonensis]|uniref:DUF4294 domain-containing protein n=1 Tax=Flavivirga rizhaonensis TaxID=2559571 RepID=A0A4S1DR99_9FLAO|nr:DUF4294 domain-containing protein [Flavivirga rizhaonensis]TGV00399.1 DUF4294 domain-containing protein [Flavivirga rizhaonensis]
MNCFKYIFLIFPVLLFAQGNDIEQDSAAVEYLIIKGDSVPRLSIDLKEVRLLHKLRFDNKKERIRYLILRRKTMKVYPYAKMAAERLDSMNKHLATLKRNREKKRYTKRIQKYIEGEFSEELKKLTRTEGQILIKLIHRQTGTTAFNLIKELRNGWRAFWYNTTASMFDLSLKREFDPVNIKEDYLIEDILLRNFQNGRLERQKSAIDFDFYDLTDKWLPTTSEDP